MRFTDTPLAGAVIVEIERREDLRGFFARTWCARECASRGLPASFVQASLSHNVHRGTVRGMHMQLPPSAEGKLVQCAQGRIHDVIVDLRPESPGYLRAFAVELCARTHRALYVPPGFLHGFQTLEGDTVVQYQMTDFHAAELGFGVRWNDPALGIDWPIEDDVVILPRDAAYPDFEPQVYARGLVESGAWQAS